MRQRVLLASGGQVMLLRQVRHLQKGAVRTCWFVPTSGAEAPAPASRSRAAAIDSSSSAYAFALSASHNLRPFK